MKKLLCLLVALMVVATLFVSCSDETQTNSSETSSVESIVSDNTSSVESVTSDDTSSVESNVSEENASSETTSSETNEKKPKIIATSVSDDDTSISLNTALSSFPGITADGELYFLKSENEGDNVNIRLMRYDADSDSVKEFLAVTVENGQYYGLEEDEPVSYAGVIYESADGNTVFAPFRFDFKCYFDMTSKRAYVYARSDVLVNLPNAIAHKDDSGSVDGEYSPNVKLEKGKIFKSHPDYGTHTGSAEVLNDAYVSLYRKDDVYTLCLYNYSTGAFTPVVSGDGLWEYRVTDDGKFLLYAHMLEKAAYCCNIQTGEVKTLPVTDRPVDNIDDDGQESYWIGDFRFSSDGEKLYWEDYEASAGLRTLCCFDFEKGVNTKIYQHPKYEEATNLVYTDKGVYIQSEIPLESHARESVEKDIFFYDGKKLYTVVENVMDFYLLEDHNVMYVQKPSSSGLKFEKVYLSEVLS